MDPLVERTLGVEGRYVMERQRRRRALAARQRREERPLREADAPGEPREPRPGLRKHLPVDVDQLDAPAPSGREDRLGERAGPRPEVEHEARTDGRRLAGRHTEHRLVTRNELADLRVVGADIDTQVTAHGVTRVVHHDRPASGPQIDGVKIPATGGWNGVRAVIARPAGSLGSRRPGARGDDGWGCGAPRVMG